MQEPGSPMFGSRGSSKAQAHPTSLLVTKLNIPPPRENLVPRPRLVRRLDQLTRYRLTLVAAPPGFGKTTLLSEWAAQKAEGARLRLEEEQDHASAVTVEPLHIAWVSLDEDDNDPARFWKYFTAALQKLGVPQTLSAITLPRLRRAQRLDTLLTPLLNDLAALSDHSVLVLDDYHLIEKPEIHSGISFLLDHLPPTVHIVILTRMDPPLPLARLRARGQLLELRTSDLRFTPEEASSFLNRVMDLQLNPAQVAALETRTEGWIAGLHLAALSMQEIGDVEGFVNAFTGSHHFILDYLVTEVLQRQSEDVQTFLFETSILDQMNASLANAVTGRSDSSEILERLEKANLFVVALDDARQWYRYHHLFSDLLSTRLHESQADHIPELHRRASLWYEQNGFTGQAIDHALAMADFDRAAQLVEQVALLLIIRSETATLLDWRSRLPEDLVLSRPFLRLIDAAALMTMGKVDLALARVAEVSDDQLDPPTRWMASLLRAVIPLLQADVPRALESTRRELEAAQAAAPESSDPQAEFKIAIIIYLTVILGELQMAAGQLRAAVECGTRGIEIGRSLAPTSPWHVILGYIHHQLTEQFYEQNDLPAADHHAQQALEICRAGRNQELESYALVALAQVREAQGDRDHAADYLLQAEQIMVKRHIPAEMRYMAAREVRVLISQNRVDKAAQVVNDLPPEDQPAWDIVERGLASVAAARVRIAERKFDQAAQLLETLRAQAEAAAQTGTLLEVLALLSVARHGQGDSAQAHDALARALGLADPEGYVRTFVDCGDAMRDMLQTDEGRRTGSYAQKLLAAFPAEPVEKMYGAPTPAPSSVSRPPPSLELLSERELTVLRLIAEGLSNQEIADRLVVAVSTVKTHINNIYNKLGVDSRTQALARARELGLV